MTRSSSGPASRACMRCTGCAGWASPSASSKPGTASAAPGTGTATRAPAATWRAWSTRTRSRRSSRQEWEWTERYRDPAGDPALPQLRRRPVRPPPRTSSFGTAVDRGRLRRGGRAVGRRRWTTATAVRARYLVMATGCLSPGTDARTSRASGPFRGDHVPHRPLAERTASTSPGKRVGVDRHRLVRRPGRSRCSPAGGRAVRVPAHAELQRCRPSNAPAGPGQGRARPGALPRGTARARSRRRRYRWTLRKNLDESALDPTPAERATPRLEQPGGRSAAATSMLAPSPT